MGEELDFEVRLENLPGHKGVRARTKLSREHLRTFGELLIQLSEDPTRTGVLMLMHENGEISLSSKGLGSDAGGG